ncbi:MAG: hypothetical protein R2857_11110 [Vampirovibrionales bacterium]
MPLARLQDQLNTYQTRLDEIEKERATLPPSEAIARRHFEELLGDVPPLDLMTRGSSTSGPKIPMSLRPSTRKIPCRNAGNSWARTL